MAIHASYRPARSFVALFLLAWCAILKPSDAFAVTYRQVEEDPRVLQLGARYPMVCSVSLDGCGTLIAPRWVLTAAHVARSISPFEPVVRFGDEPDMTYSIKAVYYHPDSASDGMRPPRVDLALLELVKPVQGIEPAILCKKADDVGALVTIVGRGDVGVAGNPPQPSDGSLRGVMNLIERSGGGRLVVRFDESPGGVELEGVGAPGDSGGGMFLATQDGPRILAGVSSASMGGRPGSYGVQDLYVRIIDVEPWIRRTMTEPPASGIPMPMVFEAKPVECLLTFVEAVRDKDSNALLAFAERYRSPAVRSQRSDAEWVKQIERISLEWGAVELEKMAVSQEATMGLLQTERGYVILELMLNQKGMLDGIGFRMVD